MRSSDWVEEFMKMPIQSGVMNTPMSVEMLALKMAAGMLPLAMETITTEEETVEGRHARKKMPSQISSGMVGPMSRRARMTKSGKARKVALWITICKRQLAMPAISFCGLRRNP